MDNTLDKIKGWQKRAQKEAEKHDSCALKRAVKNVVPDREERQALYELFQEHKDYIDYLCLQVLPNKSRLTVKDLQQEAYILFQRSMVRYDENESSLTTWLGLDLKGLLFKYVKRHDMETVGENQEKYVGSHNDFNPSLSIPKIYEELIDEGKINDDVAEMYNRMTK